MEKDAKIYVAGHNGMVGSAIVEKLKEEGYVNVIGRTHAELDLTRQEETEEFFSAENPDYVFLAAAKVGGIGEHIGQSAKYLMDNLQIQCNVLRSSFEHKVKKLLFVASACVYPQEAVQPIKEGALLAGCPGTSHEGYSIAKIAGLKQCEYYKKEQGADFISVVPCNLYGYNDSFDMERAHIVPAMIRKFYAAEMRKQNSVTIWGTGQARRELLFAEDLADACLLLMGNDTEEVFFNVGYGKDFTVMEIAEMVKEIVGFKGEILTDASMPEGMKRRILDSSRISSCGWIPKTDIKKGIRNTYEWFLKKVNNCNSGGGY